jgi:hypothetical protein
MHVSTQIRAICDFLTTIVINKKTHSAAFVALWMRKSSVFFNIRQYISEFASVSTLAPAWAIWGIFAEFVNSG